MGIKRIRRAIREGRYEFTVHALEEMDEDDLDESDVRYGILHGEISSELTDDPRGIRFSCLEILKIKLVRWKLFVVSCRQIYCV